MMDNFQYYKIESHTPGDILWYTINGEYYGFVNSYSFNLADAKRMLDSIKGNPLGDGKEFRIVHVMQTEEVVA